MIGHTGGICVLAYGLRQCAGATANLEPAPGSGRGEPMDELFGHLPTPPAHEVLIRLASDPLIGRFIQGGSSVVTLIFVVQTNHTGRKNMIVDKS